MLKLVGEEIRGADIDIPLGMVCPAFTIAEAALTDDTGGRIAVLEETAVTLVADVLQIHWMPFWPEHSALAKVAREIENSVTDETKQTKPPSKLSSFLSLMLTSNIFRHLCSFLFMTFNQLFDHITNTN